MRSQAVLLEAVLVAMVIVFFILLLRPLHVDAYPAVEAKERADREVVASILG